jgi:2-keto-4-pentenoate hydratase/2-oxohepta-3-ene-1,7-dioic acid hydratase in catechol pathway
MTLRMMLVAGLSLSGLAPVVGAELRSVTCYVRFEKDGKSSYGLQEGDRVRVVSGDIFGEWSRTDKIYPLAEVKLLVPVARCSKILAMAGNYKSHLGTQPEPGNPELFFKPPSSLIADGEPIVIPPGTSDVHYEAELVIVIGKRARNVSREKAKEYILGVTCGNDVSARDWQKGDRQWWRAKGADTFAPCGPCIVSGLNYDDVGMELRLNGETKQKTRTSEMIHDAAATVSFISRHVTLEPGDLIYTGTPGTTSAIKPGDVVEVDIEGIGVLKNRVAGSAGGASQ